MKATMGRVVWYFDADLHREFPAVVVGVLTDGSLKLLVFGYVGAYPADRVPYQGQASLVPIADPGRGRAPSWRWPPHVRE